MRKMIATLGLTAAFAVPGFALTTTVAAQDADDTDDTVTTCPYDGERPEDGDGVMYQHRYGQEDGVGNGTGYGPGDGSGPQAGQAGERGRGGEGHGVQDGSGPIELQDGTGAGNRHGGGR